MTAHIPRPKTVSLPAWRVPSQQHAASAASSPRGRTQAPPRWRVQGRAKRQQGRGGWAVKKGGDHRRTQTGHRGGSGGRSRQDTSAEAHRSGQRHQSPQGHKQLQTPLARAGEAGTGQGDRAAGSGDGCGWTADTLSRGWESASNTHAKLRTKHTEKQTHTQQWIQPNRQNTGGRLGQCWLPACLWRTRAYIQALPEGLPRRAVRGARSARGWAGSSAKMLPQRSA